MSMSRLRKYLIGTLITFIVVGYMAHSLTAPTPAPAVTLSTLKGDKIDLAAQKGKVVLVNFWATTCSVCAHEMPDLIQTYNAYKDKGFEVVAVAMPYDRPDYVLSYAKKHALPFPVSLDVMGDTMRAFGQIQGTPTSFIIGKDGNIVEKRVGELDFSWLDAYLKKQLG
jgi:peroxiredoxin